MKRNHLIALVLVTIVLAVIFLQWQQPLSLKTQWQLITAQGQIHSFDDYQFIDARLPRLIMALVIGAVFGLVGSLMQQLTQNPLTSPLTLGTSSGAWCALILLSIFAPAASANYSALAALAGALLAFALILILTGLKNLTGLPVVISGMVVNILLGAVASALILLNREYAQNVFMWGAGDLSQNGWHWLSWLWPKLLVALPLVYLAPRVLTLLRLGQQGAAGRGLAVVPWFFVLLTAGIFLVSASITAVGLIGFIGLLTPNFARSLGARTPKMELYASIILGALLLLVTDQLALVASSYFGQLVPSGVTAAAIGAPALIWFARKKNQAQDSFQISLPGAKSQISLTNCCALALLLLAVVALYLSYQPASSSFSWLSSYQWSIRWPRALTAISVGIGLAIAGTILQRLVYNPLASPELLGISSGATFALIFASLFLGQSLLEAHWVNALLGSLSVLAILILLGRRHKYAPSTLILTGIALSATLQAFVQFCLAKGGQDSDIIVQWLTGSTYRVTPNQAIILAIGVLLLSILSFGLSRALALLSISRSFAASRGLNVELTSLILLTIVALLCALITATLGPIAFIGLIAPHMAMMLGARKPTLQFLLASLCGVTLMLWADWLGQVWLYPKQIAAGTLVAVIGSVYFLGLLLLNRYRQFKGRQLALNYSVQ